MRLTSFFFTFSLVSFLAVTACKEKQSQNNDLEDFGVSSVNQGIEEAFLANDLSSIYVTNSEWEKELSKPNRTSNLANDVTLYLRKVHAMGGQTIPFTMITYCNEKTGWLYHFPLMDEYYYHYTSVATNYQILKRGQFEMEAFNYQRDITLNQLSFDKNFNHIFFTDSIYYDFSLSNRVKLGSVKSLLDTVLLNYQYMEEISSNVDIAAILKDISKYPYLQDSLVFNKGTVVNNVSNIDLKNSDETNEVKYYYRWQNAVFEVKIYEVESKPKIETTLLNKDLFTTPVW